MQKQIPCGCGVGNAANAAFFYAVSMRQNHEMKSEDMNTKINVDMNAPTVQRIRLIKNETGSIQISVYRDGEKLPLTYGGGEYNCFVLKGTRYISPSKETSGSVLFWKADLTGGGYAVILRTKQAKEICRFELLVDVVDEEIYEGASDFKSLYCSSILANNVISCGGIEANYGLEPNVSAAGIYTPHEAGGLWVGRQKPKTVKIGETVITAKTSVNATAVTNKVCLPLSGIYLHEDYSWNKQGLNDMKRLQLTPITVDGVTLSVLAVV